MGHESGRAEFVAVLCWLAQGRPLWENFEASEDKGRSFGRVIFWNLPPSTRKHRFRNIDTNKIALLTES